MSPLYFVSIFLDRTTEMEFMKVLFRWGFWAWPSDYSDLRFLLSFLPVYKSYSWTNLTFLHWLIVLYGFLKPTIGVVWFSARFSSFQCISNFRFYGEKNATFKGKQRDIVNKAKPPPPFSCLCRTFKCKKTTGGSKIRWWRWLWIAWSKSHKILSPLRQKNTPSFMYSVQNNPNAQGERTE